MLSIGLHSGLFILSMLSIRMHLGLSVLQHVDLCNAKL